MYCIEENTCAIVGTFRRYRSHSALPAVIRRPGNCAPLSTPRYTPGMTNFNLQKCNETDLKEYLPNITQSIWNKTNLLVAMASNHAFMDRLQRAMLVSLSAIAPQNNVH